MQATLDGYKAGISVVRVNFAKAAPPGEAKPALEKLPFFDQSDVAEPSTPSMFWRLVDEKFDKGS